MYATWSLKSIRNIIYVLGSASDSEAGKDKTVLHLLVHSPGSPGPPEVRSQEPHLCLPQEWQEPKQLSHSLLPSQVH